MSLKKLINSSVPYLKPEDSSQKALDIMDEYKLSHLAVVGEKKDYIGLLSEESLLENSPDAKAADTEDINPICIDVDKHLFDVLAVVSSHKISLLPVVDDKKKYLGAVTYKNIIDQMAEETSAFVQGGVLEIETEEKNFSPALIAGISENNSLKVMSMFSSPKDSKNINALIKLNGPDTEGVIQGLERQGYNVKNIYKGSNKYSELLQERYGSLLSYMNV